MCFSSDNRIVSGKMPCRYIHQNLSIYSNYIYIYNYKLYLDKYIIFPYNIYVGYM